MSGIDVLAVLDDLVADMGDTPGTTGQQVEQVRAAVAELIEAARSVRPCFHCEGDTFGEFDGLIAAIARCRGGAA